MTISALAVVPPHAPPPSAPQDVRPGRALIGWMKPDYAYGLLQRTMEPTAVADAVQHARQAVAARPAAAGQDAIITSVPAELAGHIQGP